jgi:molybdopterin/thiamine biosynthesis adenylyltransferase
MRRILKGSSSDTSPILLDYNELNSFISEYNIRKEDICCLGEFQRNSLTKIASEVVYTEDLLLQLKNGFAIDYGNWVYFPRINRLIQIIGKEDFINVRTLRNKYKINIQEQELLNHREVSIIGLSAGNSVAMAIATERICGKLNLFDFDSFELANMNRVSSGIGSIGWNKAVHTANQILEIDPYLDVNVITTGYKGGVEDIEILKRSDVIVDECDSFDIKIELRKFCKEHKKPIFMHTSERGILDIELYDKEPERPIFHGLLENVDLKNHREVLVHLINPQIVSDRMQYSFSEIGKSISSWPQLASEVLAGGANIATSVRYYLLGQSIKSGRYFINCEDLIC